MPFVGTTPEQDVKIDSCISKISGTNPQTKKAFTESEKVAICKSQVVSNKSYLFSQSLVIKAEGEDYYIEGIASSTNPDLDHDIVSIEALQEMAATINERAQSNPIPLGYEHTEFLGGKPNLVPLGHLLKGWVEDGKLKVRGWLNKSLSVFKEAKTALDRKDLHALSIEYIPTETSNVDIGGVLHRVIHKLKLAGMAFTSRPMNRDSMIDFYAKNLDFAGLENKIEVKEMETKDEVKAPEEDKKEEEKAPEAIPTAPVDEKAPETSEEKSSVVGKKTVEISKEQFAKLEEMERKEATASEESRMKVMFDKFYADEKAKFAPAGAPKLNGDKFEKGNMPEELKEWETAIDSGNSELMFKAAGNLINYYEDKGLQMGTSPRSPKRLFFKTYKTSGENTQSWASSKFELKSVELKAQIEHDTDRTVTGTEYFLSGPLLNDVFAPGIITHLNEQHVLYSILRKEDGSDFGDTYGFRFKYARSGATANYDESGSDNPTAAIINRKKAHVPFMWYRMVGQVSGPTMAAARGRGGIGDAFAVEVRDQSEDLLFAMNTDFFDTSSPSDGMTRGGQVLSLRWLVDNADTHTTLYGHDRSSGNFTTLQGVLVAKSGTPNVTKDDMRTSYTSAISNGASMNDLVFVTGYTQRRKILGLLDDAQRFGGTVPRAGFEGDPMFDGIPIFADKECETTSPGFIYLLDMRHTFLVVQLPPTMEELAQTGDFRKFQLKTYFNLASTAPNHNHLTTGYNTS